MNPPLQKKRTEEQLRKLHGFCREFSLRELVDVKIEQILDQMGTLDGKGDLYIRIIGEVEKSLIGKTMNKTKGNKTHTAEILGMTRNTLRNKISCWLKKSG